MKKYLALLICLQLALGGALGWDYYHSQKNDKVIYAHIKHMANSLDDAFVTEILTYHRLAKHEEHPASCSKCKPLIEAMVADYKDILENGND